MFSNKLSNKRVVLYHYVFFSVHCFYDDQNTENECSSYYSRMFEKQIPSPWYLKVEYNTRFYQNKYL